MELMDRDWAYSVKVKAWMMCEYCWSGDNLHAHHMFTRKNMNTRRDLNNGFSLCRDHHTDGDFSAHLSPDKFTERAKSYRGEEWYNELSAKAVAIRDKNIDRTKAYMNSQKVYIKKPCN